MTIAFICITRNMPARLALRETFHRDQLDLHIQAAKEAGKDVDEPERPPPTGKLTKWHNSKPRRRS
jgi:hypothetical protein